MKKVLFALTIALVPAYAGAQPAPTNSFPAVTSQPANPAAPAVTSQPPVPPTAGPTSQPAFPAPPPTARPATAAPVRATTPPPAKPRAKPAPAHHATPKPAAMMVPGRLQATVTGEHYTFRPPAAWSMHRLESMVRADFWLPTSSTGVPAENINILAQANDAPFADYMSTSLAKLKSVYGGAAILNWHAQPTCNGTRQGYYLEWNERIGERAFRIEQTLDQGGGYVAIATYTRKAGYPRNPVAHAALSTLCGKSLDDDAAS